jgi:hypothetical protein
MLEVNPHELDNKQKKEDGKEGGKRKMAIKNHTSITKKINTSATQTLSTSCSGGQLSSYRKWNAIGDL